MTKPTDSKPGILAKLRGKFKKEEGAPTAEEVEAKFAAGLSDEQKDQFALLMRLVAAKSAPPEAPSGGEPPKDDPKPKDDDEMTKAFAKLNPQLGEAFAKMQADNEALRAENKSIRGDLDGEMRKTRRADFRKAAEQLEFTPADHDSLAELLDEADKGLSDGAQETLAKLLRRTEDTTRRSTVLKALGTSAPGPDSAGDDPLEDLNAKAEELRKSFAKANAGKTLSAAQAFKLAAAQNPDIYAKIYADKA